MKARTAIESRFATHDGETIFYRHWPALTGRTAGSIVLLHRGHEHSGRLAHLVHELELPDFAFFAWDARGHGRSSGARGYSPSVGASLRDLQGFIDHIAETQGTPAEEIAVVGQSVGALLAAAWVHDYAPKLRALVLAAPAFDIKLYVPFAMPALRLAQRLRGNRFVRSYVKGSWLTRDAERAAAYDSDPLITPLISTNMLIGLHDLASRLVEDAPAITVPTQLLISGSDRVVRQAPQHRFFERLGAEIKERHLLDGFRHDTLGEKDRRHALETLRGFIKARFAEPCHVPALLDADRRGFTRQEADRLARPLPAASPRGLGWSALRLGLKAGAWLSEGVRTGRRTGFDSGSTLDYVYRNQARGLTPLGRWLDRLYLDSIGWRGIRQRKVHIEEILRAAIDRVVAAGAPLRLLDIAAGHGRYVLEAIERGGARPESILLRDYSDLNVEAGRKLIEEKGLADIATFVAGDAFDGESLAAVEPKPSIAVVSGLYELFPDNGPIRESLEGLAQAVPAGGYLVYTNQPWHPQLEMIARCLTSHREGRPWIMRRRSQVEMDQLVAAAGFEKLEQRIDDWGIFSVSLARRVGG